MDDNGKTGLQAKSQKEGAERKSRDSVWRMVWGICCSLFLFPYTQFYCPDNVFLEGCYYIAYENDRLQSTTFKQDDSILSVKMYRLQSAIFKFHPLSHLNLNCLMTQGWVGEGFKLILML